MLTCDLAKARTNIPENFVKVIPDNTLLPKFTKASVALDSFVPVALVNARTICEINSTPIPIHLK